MKRFIAIEGVQCAGKTAICRMLAERRCWEYLKPDTRPIKGADMAGRARYEAYLEAYAAVSDRVRSAEEGLFVTERYAASLAVYHAPFAGDDPAALMAARGLVAPDLQILLWCDKADLARRLAQKEGPDIAATLARERALQQRYLAIRPKLVRVRNSGRNLGETAEEIARLASL